MDSCVQSWYNIYLRQSVVSRNHLLLSLAYALIQPLSLSLFTVTAWQTHGKKSETAVVEVEEKYQRLGVRQVV